MVLEVHSLEDRQSNGGGGGVVGGSEKKIEKTKNHISMVYM